MPNGMSLTVEELYDKDKFDLSTMEPGDVFQLLQYVYSSAVFFFSSCHHYTPPPPPLSFSQNISELEKSLIPIC
jgi:hypothetical protein